MDFRRYPFLCMRQHLGRTSGLVALVALIAGAALTGFAVPGSLSRGLASLEARLGADIICAPRTAKSTHDLHEVLIEGVPASFYMDRAIMDEVASIEGVERVSPQYFLATVKAGCCTMPIQVIGIDPETDFTIGPWIDRSLGHGIGRGEVVVGCDISGAPGSKISFFGRPVTIAGKLDETGTALDTAAFCDADTLCDLIKGSAEQGLGVLKDKDPASVISTVQVKVAPGHNVDAVAGDINVHLRDVWAVSARAMTTGVADGMAGVTSIVGTLMMAVLTICVLVLVVAFWVLARQRTREFGVLRVLGASVRQVMCAVCLEGLVVSALGAAIGVVAGVAVTASFSPAIEGALGLPYLSEDMGGMLVLALGTFALSSVVCGGTCAVSAVRLARLDPSAVLRGE